MRSELPRPTKANATGLRTSSTLTRTGTDQLTLKLGQAAKHGQHQPAMRGSGVRPSGLERTEARTTLAIFVQHVQQVARRSAPTDPAVSPSARRRARADESPVERHSSRAGTTISYIP